MNLDTAPTPNWTPRLLTVGRVNLDMYVEGLGVAMADASSFRASVGGSPTNIAIAAARLGLPSAVLSAVGADFAGELVRKQLAATGVRTDWVLTLPGSTSLALLATLSADVGERQFYRDDPADARVDRAVVAVLPWGSLEAIAISADAVARGDMADTITAIVEQADRRAIPVWWDLDLRVSTWADPGHYARIVRAAVQDASVVIGTENEFAALFGLDADDVTGVEKALAEAAFPQVVLKRGGAGAALFIDGHEQTSAPAEVIDPVCTVGGGDATAGSLIAARLSGFDWEHALRLAMRVAGRTVQQPYCSSGFPTLTDIGLSALDPDQLDEVSA
jgi:sugar/nucleoside kinase (ribokinase family)